MSRPSNIRTSITVYTRYVSHETGLVRPFRRVLNNVFYDQNFTEIVRTTGIVPQSGIFCQCFLEDGIEFVLPHIWDSLPESELNGKWSVHTGTSGTNSIVVSEVVDFEFDWNNPAQVSKSETEFLKTHHLARRVTNFDDKRHGTPKVQYIGLVI